MTPIESIDRDQLVRFAATIVGEQDAENVVQSAYVDLLQSASQYEDRGEATFKTWMYAVVKNTAYDFLRRQGAKKRNRPRGAGHTNRDDEPIDPRLGIDDRIAIREEIHDALASLPARYRAAVVAYAKHENYKDAARELGITVKAFDHLLERARARIRQRRAA